MVAIRWGLAAVLTAIFFLIGGFLIEFVFIGIGKVAELSGSSSDEAPSYLLVAVRRITGFLFGSALAVYAVVRLVKDLNQDLYLKVFCRFIIAVQALMVLFTAVMIGFSAALVLIVVPIFECLGALFGAHYGFALALTKERVPEVTND